jgi:hypothetical protein
MEALLQLKRLEEGAIWAEEEFKPTGEQPTVEMLIMKLDLLCSVLPFANSQMSIAKKEFNRAKVRAYNTYIGSSIANSLNMTPMLIKDYISAKLEEEQYAYDVAERLSRTIIHLIDALRTSISALKQERITNEYYSNTLKQ